MKKSSIKLAVAGLAALSLVVAACGGSSSSTDTTAAAATPTECTTPTPVKLQLQWFTQAQFAGYYAALENGYYTDMCLDVTILEGAVDPCRIDEVVCRKRLCNLAQSTGTKCGPVPLYGSQNCGPSFGHNGLRFGVFWGRPKRSRKPNYQQYRQFQERRGLGLRTRCMPSWINLLRCIHSARKRCLSGWRCK